MILVARESFHESPQKVSHIVKTWAVLTFHEIFLAVNSSAENPQNDIEASLGAL